MAFLNDAYIFRPTELLFEHFVVSLQTLSHGTFTLNFLNDGPQVLKLHLGVRETTNLELGGTLNYLQSTA